MVYAIVLYFAFATAALAFLVLPQTRAWAAARAQRFAAHGARAGQRVADGSRRGAQSAFSNLDAAAVATGGWFVARRRFIAIAAAFLLGAPLLALGLALSGHLNLAGFDHRASREVDERVAGLLKGEQLVPPAPLPPELFATAEVEQALPLARTASRQWELLDPEFRQRLLLAWKLMQQEHGIEMVLLEGYRSPERQAQLAALGPSVTRATAGMSYHQVGLAADAAFLRNGRIVISEQDAWAAAAYERYGAVARSVGLVWGGDWKSIRDLGHVELRRDGALPAKPAAAR